MLAARHDDEDNDDDHQSCRGEYIGCIMKIHIIL